VPCTVVVLALGTSSCQVDKFDTGPSCWRGGLLGLDGELELAC